ncbi:hypothetical protein [Kitasatospora sp. NRRL B-11411]|uniref:hypothetical protein n=1 Tax=Kitasatospora sp. NRRL B-11411 TaxID=1463822 RepID=UPI000B18BD67|nr:hypothetical protein [Kitasatospora sp. NRRL B-11411]
MAVEFPGEAYEGASYAALPAKWASVSDRHLNQSEQYVIGQVAEAAIGPLADTVANAVSGPVVQGVEGGLGASGGDGGGTGFRIDPDAPDEHARMMHEHAGTVAGRARMFRSRIAGVAFA